MKKQKHMKEKNISTKKGKCLNKKVIAIGTTAILALATIIGVYLLNRDNSLAGISPEIARSMEYEQVQDGDEDLEETNNVKFDAFFLRDLNGDGYAESIRGTCNEIGEEATLYMELNVLTEGYLKDGKITINSDNFYLQTNLPKDEELAENYVGNNIKEIKLNQINNGTQKLITGIVRSGDYSYSYSKANAIGSNINNYSKVNSVTLTGTYVYTDAEGQEQNIEINKTVDFNVDWHGTTRASIYNANQSTYIDSLINEEEQLLNLNFTVYTEETDKELLLSNNHVEVEIPELNGYAPVEVVYTGSNATANYNEETRILTLDRTSSVGEDGTVNNKLSTQNSYSVRVTYQLEAYTALGVNSVQLKIPVSTYYEGYNNTNDEFTNPYRSNIARTTITATYSKYQGTNASIDITVGDYISRPSWRYVVSKQKPIRLYNGQSEEERDDTYIVKWQGYIGTNTELNTITMKETQNDQAQVVDQFIKTDSSQESMEDVTSNVGIYFSGMDDLLGTEGYINVYDEETDNLLVTFTAVDWNKYTSSNPYRYETAVKHIRVEMSPAIKNDTYFYVYNVKELDDEEILNKYERTQFDELQYIKSQLVMYIGETLIGTDTHQANYEAPYSIASISISNNTLSTQVTEENDIITITADANTSANQVRWVDGTFLVKLPEEILTAEINNVEISNSNVSLESYELIEQDGTNFIKIVTSNDQETTYDITIDVDLTPDPRMATTTKNIELYATNENGNDYYYKAQDIYDVNNNLNTTEQVNHTTTSISMVSPNSLLTNQTASEYDDKESTVVSPQVADIKPVYAVVDQEQEEQTVKIGVQIKNNYASTISEIQILGKIPFEGNTYVLSGSDLGSTFTTKMVDTGIDVPQELLDTATIYYSTNENPDRDLTKVENNWKTADQVENWDEIKTFLIDLGDYVMPTGQEYVFYYTVKIPNGLEFNQTAFSHHGIYFSLDTEDGKYRTQTEPNKLGFRIAEKYNLELSKFQTGKEKLVPGATYSIQEIITEEDGTETRGEAKTGVTNAQGQLTITNLYAEKTYEIREIKTPDNYELNNEVIRFIGHVDENGILTIEKTGETKQDPQVIKEDGEDYKVTVEVEDEVKASIKITKKEQGTENLLSGVRYKLTGYNLPEKGKTIRTNSNGEASINGISINQEYTLEEIKADGYYLASPIKFKVVNNEGNYSIEQITEEGVESGIIASQSTTEEDSIPTINITLEDEKIPTYNLQLFKIKKTTESTVSDDELIARAETDLAGTEVTPLANATFKLFKGDEELGKYTTDEQGLVTIEGLYQYESEKDIDQTYTLKEVMSPEGYAKVQDISFRVQKDAETNELILIDENNVDRKYTVKGNTVTLTIEDSPSFKLIKKDAETKEALANIKFAIYNVDDGTEQPARNSKGEIIGTKETINGREYYTVQTDSNGELTVDLPEGLYKAVEVQAPEQYDLSNQTYYFGIGASREAPTTYVPTQAKSISARDIDSVTSVAATSDGGYVAGGYFGRGSIELDNGQILENVNSYLGYDDGIVVKYNEEGKVLWARSIGGEYDDEVNSVAVTEEGDIIIVGRFSSDSIRLEEGKTIKNIGSYDGMVIKYNGEGDILWARSIGGSGEDRVNSVTVTKNGDIIVGGYFEDEDIDLGEGKTLENAGGSDGMVIKYNGEGDVLWAKNIGGDGDDSVESVSITKEGNLIVGGYFESKNIDLENGKILENVGSSDGMVIKYNEGGEVEWSRTIGGEYDDEVNSVAVTEKDIIVGGHFNSTSINLINGQILENAGGSDGMVIKYNEEGKVEWSRSIGGNDDDYVPSIATTPDGEIIVGGYFKSDRIDLGESQILGKTNGSMYYDGMVIRYGVAGEVNWITSIEGTRDILIKSVDSIRDGEIIVGGSFKHNITVGDYTLSSGNDFSDGMVIKYESIELNKPTTIQAQSIGGRNPDQITSVSATSDGGYIVGGYFNSSITVGEYTLTNAGGYDGIVIRYGADGEVEWATSIECSVNDEINSVTATSDGGIIVGGNFESSATVGDYTLTSTGGSDGMVIKYGADGEVEWATRVGERNNDEINLVAETSDGGYIVGGYFQSRSIAVGDYTLNNNSSNTDDSDGMVIKYGADGEVEWATSIGGDAYDEINSVSETTDGGYIVGGYFKSKSIAVGKYTLINNSSLSGYSDGMIVKYDKEGEVEWARSIGGSIDDRINSVSGTSDGGYIVGGYFYNSITVGDYTLTNAGNQDGMVIKYSADGEVEWAKSVGGSSLDKINSVTELNDDSIIAGGYFKSSSITVGDYTLTNAGNQDGMVIKYSRDGEVEWAKSVGGADDDYIESVTGLNDGSIIAGGYFESSTIETDGHTLTNRSSSTSYSDGMILRIVNQVGAPEVQELTVENSRKVFNITTDVNEIEGIKGGSISGEDLNPYEEVKYGDNSVNEIKMTPDEGYEIIGITVNGEEWPFVENEDGTYTIPQFENVTEDKHIVVTYSKKDNKIVLNKIDSETKESLEGITFKLDQIEERTEPENVIGTLTDNGATYTEVTVDTSNDVTEQVIGELTNNGTYYFVQNEDGTLTPTNSKTYQLAHEGTSGIQNVTANSYVEIDLSGLEGQYAVVVNANIYSESADYGYATITQNTTAPSYSSSTGRFMYISGTQSAKDYTTTIALQGGQIYYLHLGYRKDGSIDTGDDQVVINSIKVYGAEEENSTYNFVSNGQGGYESNNQGQASTVANSYIPIDLTGLTGKYNLTVNANVSSQSSYDYGYATVTSTTTAPSYSSSTGRFIYISGTSSTQTTPTDYTTVLQGGSMYYLHFGYRKDTSTDSGDDKFTVNSVEVTLNDSELYHTEVTTNSEGQAITQIPFGKYQVTEVNTPEGYESIEPITINFKDEDKSVVENNNNIQVTVNENGEYTIENKQLQRVIVHHYLKEEDGTLTTTPVAEDEVLVGKAGERYETKPHLDLKKYELEKDAEGNYVIPEEANGTYDDDSSTDQEVIYYYETKDYPLIVHHYIEGTTNSVPLKDGSVAEDVTSTGKEGDLYTTNAIEDSLLDERYELVETPENANGNYIAGETIVTYYYKIAQRPLTITKTGQDGLPLPGVTFEIQTKEEADKEAQIGDIGEIQPNGDYYFVKQDGKYISNNQQQNSTTASSYIKIDLTGKESATLKINAEISSQSSDYGYATVTNNTTVPSYSSSTGRIFRISGQTSARDYITTLNGGQVYYLHLCYYKNSSTSSYNDTFTVNSIKINDYDVLSKQSYVTNDQGKINVILDAGEYVITETEVPEGYKIPDNSTQTINITKDQNFYELNIQNEKIPAQVTVHHYIEGTTDKVPATDGWNVVEDEIKTGVVGDIYATKVSENVSNLYKFVSSTDNTSGTMTEEPIEVIYYYALRTGTLTINKIDEQGQGLEGAEFEVSSNDAGKISYTTTETDGKVQVELPIGATTVTETKAPEGYRIINTEGQQITIIEDQNTEVTFTNDKINYFNLKINKVDSETNEKLKNAKFKLTYNVSYGDVGEQKVENYETTEDGSVTLNNLMDEVEYTLEETEPAPGYVVNNEKYRFIIHYTDGEYTVEMLEGGFDNQEINGNEINITINNTPSFKIVKQSPDGVRLANAKLTITDEEGNDAVDGYGNPVGQIENIEGENLRVVTTDENGEIVENLLPGTYKITEVQAPYGYKLADNEEDRVTTIEVTKETSAVKTVEQTGIMYYKGIPNIARPHDPTIWSLEQKYNNLNWIYYIVGLDLLSHTINNNGELVLAGSYIYATIPAENTVEGKEIKLEGQGTIILILNKELKVSDFYVINGDVDISEIIISKEGDVIALGSFDGTINFLAEQTVNNQEINITSEDNNCFIISYNKEGKVKWLDSLPYDLGSLKIVKNKLMILVGNMRFSTISIPGYMTVTGEEITHTDKTCILVINLDGKVEKIIPYYDDYHRYLLITLDEEYINLTTSRGSTYIIDAPNTVNGEEIILTDVTDNYIVLKENSEQKVEWAKAIRGDYENYNIGAQEINNGYLILMIYSGTVNIPAEDTVSGKELTITYVPETEYDYGIAIIKLNQEGQIEWLEDGNTQIYGNAGIEIRENDNGYSVVVGTQAQDFSNTMAMITLQEQEATSIANEQKVITITNEVMNSSVTVHHYIEGTEEQVPAVGGGVVQDETITGQVGTDYSTEKADNVAPNYEYVSSTNNTSGKITENPTEVIYYYRIKDAVIEQLIDKTSSPDTITEEDQKVTYNITYTGTITDYIGNAKVTIVDTLPFSIDTTAGKSSLDGGSYDAGQNTITWEENVSDIDTFTDPSTGQISITKQITVTYADMDFSKTSFENKAEATIELDATEQEEGPVEDTVTTNTNFRTEVTVTKVWNHTNNIYGNPTQVELQVKNGENVVARQIVNSSNKVGDDENTWSYTFTNLPKYDENGLLIDYTVDEAEVNPGDLAYYDKQIDGNTITNTYAGPIISAVKESETADEDRGYVLEGKTITYTITVTNDGGRDKVVTVQDSAPEGTTFKAGSIKVNGSGADNYTETNLNSGIQVNVPADGTTTVSFEVTVNPLQGADLEALTKVIRNTATVDGEETEEVTDTVNKSKLTFNKTSESENRLDYVVEGEKITYTINLSNEGTAPTTTIVKDSAPEGTTFALGSIVVKVDNVQINTDKTYTEEELEQGISVEVPAGKTASVSFQVTVNNLNDGTLIKNKATVGDSEEPNTNETEDKYVEPIISSQKTSEILNVTGRDYALEGEKIKYTITVTNNGGLSGDATITDTTRRNNICARKHKSKWSYIRGRQYRSKIK